MTPITIDIPERQVDAFTAKAKAQGLSLEDWFRQVAAKESETDTTASSQKPSFEEWERTFNEWIDSHDPNTPVLSDEAMRREISIPTGVKRRCWSIARSYCAPCSREAPITMRRRGYPHPEKTGAEGFLSAAKPCRDMGGRHKARTGQRFGF